MYRPILGLTALRTVVTVDLVVKGQQVVVTVDVGGRTVSVPSPSGRGRMARRMMESRSPESSVHGPRTAGSAVSHRRSGGDVEREVVFEVSHQWSFAFKAAAFRRRSELCLSLPIWKRLQPGRYYTRLTDLATLRPEKT